MAVNTQDIIDELKILLAPTTDITRLPAAHLNHIRSQIADPTLNEPLMAAYTKNLSSNEKTKFINQILVDATEQQKWTQLSKTDAELQKEAEEAARIQAEKLAIQQAELLAAEQQRILVAQQEEQQRVLLLQQQQLAQQQQLERERKAELERIEKNRQTSIAAARASGIH